MEIIKFIKKNKPEPKIKQKIISFLHEHLNEYRDSEADIEKAMDYAFEVDNRRGGCVFTGWIGEQLIGAVVVNYTGMQGYIPENILVYIATHQDYRGKGYGVQLMKEALLSCKGDFALHVEPTNPAVGIYKKIGFESKYLEMRLKK
jgi:[ribosomal protein S18]-alanine N-acetyltransferase